MSRFLSSSNPAEKPKSGKKKENQQTDYGSISSLINNEVRTKLHYLRLTIIGMDP